MTALPPLNTDTVWAILNEEIDNAIANQLVWTALGYQHNPETDTWDNANVAEDWREKYPEPPDFVAFRPPVVKLTRSIPKENKQLLKEQLGFKGYKINELTPHRTRRATIANWLLSYMRIHGLLESNS